VADANELSTRALATPAATNRRSHPIQPDDGVVLVLRLVDLEGVYQYKAVGGACQTSRARTLLGGPD
jgi:hypothetical protein